MIGVEHVLFLEEWERRAACSRGDSGTQQSATVKMRRACSSGLTGRDLSGDKSGHCPPGRKTRRGCGGETGEQGGEKHNST